MYRTIFAFVCSFFIQLFIVEIILRKNRNNFLVQYFVKILCMNFVLSSYNWYINLRFMRIRIFWANLFL